MTDSSSRPCAVYRHYDTLGTLRYVGLSVDPDHRWSQHIDSGAAWTSEAARRDDVWFSTVFEAQFAEYLAIKHERPTDNKAPGSRPLYWGRPQQGISYSGLELHATAIRQYEIDLIPGLLQTEQYTRAMHKVCTDYTPEQIERRVAERAFVRRRMTNQGLPTLSAFIRESALWRCGPGPAGPAQLRHLIEQAQLPNVDLRVLPMDGMPIPGGPYTLLDMHGWLLPRIAWVGYSRGGHLVDEETSMASMAASHEMAQQTALSPEDSIDLIADLIQETRAA